MAGPYDHIFFLGDAPLVRIVFRDIDGNELTPVSGTINAINSDNQSQIVQDGVATVVGNELQYLMPVITQLGPHLLYATATFASGEIRTGVRTYNVVAIDGRGV